MKINVGTIDRVVRIIAGIGLIAAAYLGTIGPWGYIGVVLVATGAVPLFLRCRRSQASMHSAQLMHRSKRLICVGSIPVTQVTRQ